MKRTWRGIIITVILASRGLPAAADIFWDLVNALTRGETQQVDRILNENADSMTAAEKRLVYGFILDYTRNENTLRALELMPKYGIHATQYDLFNAINRSHGNSVVDIILDEGIRPNGEILLLAAEKQRWDLVRAFAELGADVDYKYPPEKSYADGMTALIHAAKNNNLEMVKFLVGRGADVNARTTGGGTAASIARENNLTEVYDYLEAQGAVDVSRDPARDLTRTENNSGQGSPGISALGISGLGISSLIENGLTVFRGGTYRLSGSSAEIKLTGYAETRLSGGGSGYLSYKNRGGSAGTGVFRVTGNTLLLITEGVTFTYQVDSAASFSGNGETWIRVGD
jgi:hypothetical protein